MDLDFSGELWFWKGVPEPESGVIADASALAVGDEVSVRLTVDV